MGYRTFHINGRADDSAGTVTVDGVVVHSGIFKDGILFEYLTDSKLHGKVDVMISMTYGSIIIDRVDVTYPAVIGGMAGFATFPQPIAQPFQPHMLPFAIEGDMEYPHYMHNGPAQWIIDGSPQRETYIEDWKEAYQSGVMKLDWQYKHKPIGGSAKIDDLSGLMRKRSIISSFAARLRRKY